jgi:hypothetical protein
LIVTCNIYLLRDKKINTIPTITIPEIDLSMRRNINQLVNNKKYSDVTIVSDDWEKFKVFLQSLLLISLVSILQSLLIFSFGTYFIAN